MTKDEALKLAKTWFERNTYGDEAVEVYEAIEQALLTATPLAAPVQQSRSDVEPVANYCRECLTYNGHQEGCSHYTTQPNQQLTIKQIIAANYPDGEENDPTISAPDFDLVCFARAIEAKLKEKNTAHPAPVQELVCVCGAVWQGQELVETPAAQPAPSCTRSHPHENMDAMCELRTEIARLTNENARLKAQPAPAQEPVAIGWDTKTDTPIMGYTTPPAAQPKE